MSRRRDKRVNHIPDAVDIWYLVSKKLDQIKPAGDTDDPPIIEHIEPARQFGRSKFLQKTENRDRRVQIDPRCPRRTECQA